MVEPPRHAVPATHGVERLRADPSLRLTWLGLVLVLTAAGVAVIGAGHWQVGSVIIGAGMIVGGVIRAVRPGSEVGLLRVRGRVADVVLMGVVGAGIILMVLSRL